MAHAELAANGVVYGLRVELLEIYCRCEEQERKEHLVTVHTSACVRGALYKGQRVNLFLLQDSGFTEEEEDKEYDDTKILKSRVSGFSCGAL